MNRGLRILPLLLFVFAPSNGLLAQWVRTSAPTGRVHRMLLDQTTIYAAYSGNSPALLGAHRSTDNGLSWISMNNGLIGGQLEAMDFAQVDSGIMLGTGQGVWLSTSQGSSWSARNSGLPSESFRSVRAMAALGNDVYITIETSTNGYLSTNRGLSWVTRPGAAGDSRILVHNGAMYTTGYVEVRKSTNSGTSWTSISGGLPSILYGTQVVAVNDTLYVSSNSEGIYRTTNGGSSWHPVNNGLTGTALYATAIAGNGSILLAGTNFDGVFLSTNRGGSWLAVNQGLTSNWITCLAIRPPYAYAGTDPFGGSGGVWRRLLTDFVTSVEGEAGITPARFALGQNYPNPFNPSTTITYDLPKDSRVSLNLYNILGQEVATLVNEEQKAGYRSVQWNASNVPSGVYFYRIQAGDFVASKRLLMLK
jgi:hypothetical protein